MTPTRQTDHWTAMARRTHGVWRAKIVVAGYDEPFEVEVIGSLAKNEEEAEAWAMITLAKELDMAVRLSYMTLQSLKFEGP